MIWFLQVRKRNLKDMEQSLNAGMTSNDIDVTDNENDSSVASKIPVIIIAIALSSASLYILIAIIIHRVKRKKSFKRASSTNSGSVRVRRANASPWLDNLSIAAASFAFLNCISDHPIAYTSQTTDVACKVMQLCSFIFYASGVASLYTFLWIRQRACYNNPTLAKMHHKICRVVSVFILPVFLIMMIIGMVLTGIVWSFETSTEGCVETSRTRTPLVIIFIGSITMQLSLLFLFIYPLKKHANTFFDNSTQGSSDGLLASLVKRSIIATGLCVLADLTAFILAVCLDYSIPFIVINYIYDANLLCNVICILGSFADWRQRLGPCCAKKEQPHKRRVFSSRYSSSLKASSNV